MSQQFTDRDVNDVEAIIAVVNTDIDAVEHAVADHAEAIFTWDYEKGARPALQKLYEKAKRSQWNVETDIDWSIDVDPAHVLGFLTDGKGEAIPRSIRENPDLPMRLWNDAEWVEFGIESLNWRISQFLHGEQGALMCTAKIVETCPWIDAKFYAATQVMDEARHVEVFAKYLRTKLDGSYPVNPHLRSLLDDIIADSRWDVTYLGMQIMVEGLALAAFGFMYNFADDPLIKQILKYVMSDEARHVAFGVITLKELYDQLSAAEIRERQEFAFDAAVRMRNRFLQQEVWERLGVDVRRVVHGMLNVPPDDLIFQQMLFAKIVPNCRKLGLLDAGDGWLREKFTEIGVIQYEHEADTEVEYEAFAAVGDRMSHRCFTVEVVDHIAHIVLARPDEFNTMIPAFWRELPAIVNELSDSGEARVIVLSSTGKHFTAGMDLSVFGGDHLSGAGEVGRVRANLRLNVLHLQEAFTALERARVPVIAAVQGGCIGGGVDMVCACDMRYATADAFFCIQEINIGMTADVGTLQRLPKLIPEAIAREYAYTGRRLPAARAYEVGLVNAVYETHDQMIAAVMATAAEIASRSPLAVWGSKEMITYARDHSVADGLNYIATWQTGMFQPADMTEAFVARAEKRDAVFDDLHAVRRGLE